MPVLTTTELIAIVALVLVAVSAVAAVLVLRRRRTDKLRSKFGGAEYARVVKDDGNRRHAEARRTVSYVRGRYIPLHPGGFRIAVVLVQEYDRKVPHQRKVHAFEVSALV